MSIRTSPQTEQLDEAFAKAQAKFKSATKSAEGQIGTRRYKYADVSEVIDAMLPFLNAEGIGIRQHPGFEYKQVGEELIPFVTVTTRLAYKGQWEESDIALPAVNKGSFDAQSCGSGLTYGSRYGLQGIGVISREDDDGAAAAGRGTHEAAQAKGKEKMEELEKKLVESIDQTACLFYVWFDESQTAEITGHRGLMKSQEDLLKRLKQGGKLIANLEQLETLKIRFEERGVPFKPLKAA